jgi:hypothetical protein
MAEEEGFLRRWSVRKRQARQLERPDESAVAAVDAAVAEPVPAVQMPAAQVPVEEEAEATIDPAELPPLDSIRSGVDVQAFLRRGVPKALRQAALRRLWAVDPQISGFREVADYDWDFNAPGYGALRPGDDPQAAAALMRSLGRRVAAPAPADRPAARGAGAERSTATARPTPEQPAAGELAPDGPATTEPAAAAPADAVTPEPPADAPASPPVGVALASTGATEDEPPPSTAQRRRRHGGATPR